jgi:transcription antitermination factor NusG
MSIVSVPGDSWHVIRTVSNQENAVAAQIKESGIESFCPMTRVTTVRHGRVVELRQALFRNYTFAKWDGDNAQQWHAVNSAKKLLGIIGGEHPTQVEPGTIEEWQRRADSDGEIVDVAGTVADLKRGYRVGSEVRLQKGRDDAMIGIVVWVDDRAQRVGIRVDILGRTPVVVRRQREVESVGAPLKTERRRSRGGKRGSKVRQRAFANYVVSALHATTV